MQKLFLSVRKSWIKEKKNLVLCSVVYQIEHLKNKVIVGL